MSEDTRSAATASPGDTIRRYIERSLIKEFPPVSATEAVTGRQAAADALDALLAENARLREEIRIREESQIPVIPHGAAVELERLLAALDDVRGDLYLWGVGEQSAVDTLAAIRETVKP